MILSLASLGSFIRTVNRSNLSCLGGLNQIDESLDYLRNIFCSIKINYDNNFDVNVNFINERMDLSYLNALEKEMAYRKDHPFTDTERMI